MRRYFSDIRLSVNQQDISEGKTPKDFYLSTSAIRTLLHYKLSLQHIQFLKIRKLAIHIQREQIHEQRFTNYNDGSAIYELLNFDFEEYFEFSQKEKNLKILSVLKEICTEIGSNEKESLQKILQTISEIENSDFTFEIESRAKQHKSKKLKGSVLYRVDENGQNAFVKITDKSGELILKEHLLENSVYEYCCNIQGLNWDDNKLQIMARDGSVFKEFAVEI